MSTLGTYISLPACLKIDYGYCAKALATKCFLPVIYSPVAIKPLVRCLKWTGIPIT